MSERFDDWKYPEFDEKGMTKWNWMCQYHENLILGKDSDIGAFTYINARCVVVIEEGVQVGSHCSIYSQSTIDGKVGAVVIKKNSKIGSHSLIMPGVTIGENAIIGAFSFVNNDIPPNTMAYGIPIKVVRELRMVKEMIKDINLISLRESDNIKEAMQRIKQTGMRITLIMDDDDVLIGVATSGDISRAILDGKELSTPLSDVMHTNPITALEGTPAIELLGVMLGKSIDEIPIVDFSGRVVDISFLSELKAIPLSSPDITQKEVKIINQVLSTSHLSIGSKIKEFEEKIADYVGTKYAIGVNSGTSALHLCIKSLDIKDGDEVITSPFSFVASANCALFERAKPVFVDIDKDTLCLDANKIEEKITDKTKAILPVHIFGHPCQMDKIMAIALKYDLVIIEDACEAIGTEYHGKKVGSFGDCGVFAFYPNKQITTGEGGMVVTNNKEIAKLCRSLRNQGRDEGDSWLSYTRLGYNYRMPELSASLGVVQMSRIDEILGKRQKVADFYNERLSNIGGLRIPYTATDVKMSWFVYVIRLDEHRFSREQRDSVIQELRGRGIDCRDYFPPIHLEPFYVKMFDYRKGSFPITEQVSMTTIALPFYNNLTEDEVNYIGDNIEDILHYY